MISLYLFSHRIMRCNPSSEFLSIHMLFVLVKTNANHLFQHQDRRNENTDNQQQPTGTSEYRGYQFCNQTETNNYIKSYSHAILLDASFTKDQAVIIDAIFKDYALSYAIGKLIGPKSISYIADNRICASLDNNELVLYLTNLHKTMSINNHTLSLRPMLTPAERVILSKFALVILSSEFGKIFQKKFVTLCFRITTLKARMTD